MLERLQLPRFSLPFWSGGGGRGRARSASAAARLQARLPTLQRPPHRWRELLVHAVDLQQEINALEPPPGLTGRWRKCKARGGGVEGRREGAGRCSFDRQAAARLAAVGMDASLTRHLIPQRPCTPAAGEQRQHGGRV